VEETAWELAPYLAPTEPLMGAKFVRPVALPPDDGELVSRHLEEVFYQRLPLRTGQTRYKGRVAVLIDERTQSQAEHTALFLRACGALLVGSPTAGAVGDVTNILLTDGIVVRFSGQDVRFPDNTRVAGVGIQPQKRARPTWRGLQAGRDEVLEAALKAILSRG
jgi:C-terminal processing protease CtpA/Prc